eukprot:305812_1
MSWQQIKQTIFSIILIICCILNLIALGHIIYKFYIKRNATQKITTLTKCVVIISTSLLTTHCIIHTIFQLFEHTHYEMSTLICKFGVVMISFTFYIGKSFLLCFYIIRAGISFRGSDIEYTNKQIIFYCIIIILLGIISTIGWPIIQLPFTRQAEDKNGNYYCIVSAAIENNYDYHHANTYFLIYASGIEIIVSIWTVWLFIGRLMYRSHITYLSKQHSCENNKSMHNSVRIILSDDENNLI